MSASGAGLICLGCGREVQALAPCPQCSPGTRTVAGYVLQEVIGRGAYGEVYAAEQPATGRRVALKLLKRGSERDVQRFRREGRALSRVDHPGVVKIFTHGIDGLPYLVLERLEGETLHERLGRGRLPVADAVRVCAEVAEAVHHLHDMGIVHRDVKPDNVMLEAGTGRAKLIDFGLAWYGDSTTLTEEGGILGTPHFMAPEQIRLQGKIDKPADVYGLGALLYACLTGSPPFAECKGVRVLTATLRTQPEPPSRFAAGVSSRLDRVCLRAMRKRPEARFRSAAAFRDALRWSLRASERPPDASSPELEAADPDVEEPPYWLAIALGVPLAAGVLVFGLGLHPGLASLCLIGLALLAFSRIHPGQLCRLIPPLTRSLGPERTRSLFTWTGVVLAGLSLALGLIPTR